MMGFVHNELLVIITNYACSLQCVDCANFIHKIPPEKKNNYIQPDHLKRDLEQLSAVLRTNRIQVQGGESTLHKDLDLLLDIVKNSNISQNIELVTNATQKPKSKLVDSLRRNNIRVRISNYQNNKQNICQWESILHSNSIRYFQYTYVGGDNLWYDMGEYQIQRNNDDAIVQNIYSRCPFKVCWTLYDGMLTKCSRSASGYISGHHNFFSEDFIDIRNSLAHILPHKLSEMLQNLFMESCRYCKGTTGKKILPGMQLNAQIFTRSTNSMKHYDIISLGNNCDPGLSLKELGLKKETYPFDWIRSNPKIIYDVLIHGPEKYVQFGHPDGNNYNIIDDFEIKHMYACFNNFKSNFPISHINSYGQHFTHYLDLTTNELIDKFNRYFKRFFDKLRNSQSIIFLHTTENYILHKLSRDYSDIYYDYLVKISKHLHENYTSLDFKILNIEVNNQRENSSSIINYSMDYNLPLSDQCEAHTDEFIVPFRKEITKILRDIFPPHKYHAVKKNGSNEKPILPCPISLHEKKIKAAFFYSLSFQLRVLEPIAREFDKIILTNNIRDLEAWKPNVIFTADSAQIPNLRKIYTINDAIIVGLRHGVANKYIPPEKEYRQADYICGSNWDKHDFETNDVSPLKDFLITGNPWIDAVFNISKREINKNTPTILFAPTYNPEVSAAIFFGNNLIPLIRKIFPQSTIIIKPHPAIIENDHDYVAMHQQLFQSLIINWENDSKKYSNVKFITDSKVAISDFYPETDILISDGSSLVFEFMALNRPILLYSSDKRVEIWKDIYDANALANSRRNIGIEFHNTDEFLYSLANVFMLHEKNHSHYQQAYTEEILGEFTDGLSYRRVAESIKNILKESLTQDHRTESCDTQQATPAIHSVDGQKQSKALRRVIAFYLPQYHPIPENDKWWGKGFTEWTNVTKAKSLFPGHYQPHLPADLGFYDLRLKEARLAQANLAHQYGISGFCYYHYWFNGKRLLHEVFDQVRASREPDFPFCLCWANENWTRAWDGGDNQILIGQNYCDEDDAQHIKWLLSAFKDPRYIKIQGKPLFLIYRASNLPDIQRTINLWRKEAQKDGFPDLYLCKVESFSNEHSDPIASGFDASVEFQPDWDNLGRKSSHFPDLNVYDYQEVVHTMMNKPDPGYIRFPCVTPSWDNSPRRGKNGCIIQNSTPYLYGKWLHHALTLAEHNPPEENIVFINAWNEWAEGNYLEPDQRNKHAYLHATHHALTTTAAQIQRHEQFTSQAIMYVQDGQLEEAEEFFSKALDEDSAVHTTLHQYAILLFQKGKLEDAVKNLNAALELDPWNAEYQNDLGTLFYLQGDIEKSLPYFYKALEIDPLYLSTLQNLADIHIEKDQLEQAHQLCDRIKAVDPNNTELERLLYSLEKKNNELGDTNQPVASNSELSSSLLKTFPDGRLRPKGLICVQPFYMMEFVTNGEVFTCCPAWIKKSIGNISKSSISEIWNSTTARYIRKKILSGEFHEVCNDICPRIAAYRHTGKLIGWDDLNDIDNLSPQLIEEIWSGQDSLTSNPTVFNLSDSTVYNHTCNLFSMNTDCHEQGSGEKNLSAQDPDNFVHPVQLREEALRLFEQGKMSTALEKMQQALSLTPEDAELLNDIGAIYYSSDDWQLAQRFFETALKINPNYDVTLKNMTELFVARGLFDQARDMCIRLKSIRLDDQETQKLWALIQNTQGQSTVESLANTLTVTPEKDSAQNKVSVEEESNNSILHENIFTSEENRNPPCLLSIIIFVHDNHDGLDLQNPVIPEFFKKEAIELIIVDLGSSNKDTQEYLRTLNDTTISVILSSKEISLSLGSRMGVEKASGDFIIFFDNSVLINTHFLHTLKKILTDSSKPDALVGKTITADKIIIEAGNTVIHDNKLLSRGEGSFINDPAYNFSCDVESGSRHCLAIRKDLWLELNGFSDTFQGLGAALIDLGKRITSAGFTVKYQPQCVLLAFHPESQPSPKNENPTINSELLLSLRPKNLPPDLIRAILSIERKKVLVLGIYLANQANNINDIVSVLDSSKNHHVTQKWVSLNGEPADKTTASVTAKTLNGFFPKFQILNDLLQLEDVSLYDYIILCDDDIVLPEQFVDSFIGLQSKLGFAIAQPARTSNSYIDHPIVEQQLGIDARETHFVEIGPVTIFARSTYDFIFPFDITSPMGWGYENVWAYQAKQKNLKIGIIDAVCVDHSIRKPVANYNWKKADEERRIYLSKHHHLPLEECFRVLNAYNISEEPV